MLNIALQTGQLNSDIKQGVWIYHLKLIDVLWNLDFFFWTPDCSLIYLSCIADCFFINDICLDVLTSNTNRSMVTLALDDRQERLIDQL